jgi:hypothetical protein
MEREFRKTRSKGKRKERKFGYDGYLTMRRAVLETCGQLFRRGHETHTEQ